MLSEMLLAATLATMPTLGDIKDAHAHVWASTMPDYKKYPEGDPNPYTYTKKGNVQCSDYAMTLAVNVWRKYPQYRDIYFYEGYMHPDHTPESYHVVTVFIIDGVRYAADSNYARIKKLENLRMDFTRYRSITGQWQEFIK